MHDDRYSSFRATFVRLTQFLHYPRLNDSSRLNLDNRKYSLLVLGWCLLVKILVLTFDNELKITLNLIRLTF